MELIGMDRFTELVRDALDSLPDDLAERMDNVVVRIEDSHPSEDVLGLYEGVPLTERELYGSMELPDTVTLYREPLCAISRSEIEVTEQVRVTVVHEVAHHFGIDDDRLEELGWA